jgi:hypothetical protein
MSHQIDNISFMQNEARLFFFILHPALKIIPHQRGMSVEKVKTSVSEPVHNRG